MTDEVDYEEDAVVETKNTSSSSRMKIKGRGHKAKGEEGDRYDGRGGIFEKIEQDSSSTAGAAQCMNI